jgi:Zn-dependent protease with chaperone function
LTVAARAVVSVVMLAGFYLLALVQLAAGVALAAWLATVTTGYVAAKVGAAVFIGTVWAVGYGTWKALRAKPPEPHGLPLGRADAPHLWATVDELAHTVGTAAPDELYLVLDVNAGVDERTRLLGLLGGRRVMYVGMPLLQAFTVAQIRAVLAHELGHYSRRHTRLADIAYRGRLALLRTVGHIGRLNITGWVFRGYAHLYLRVEGAVSRRQELEADLAGVRVAGREAAASALRETRVLAAAYDVFLDRYVMPGLDAGYAPDDLFAGFAALLRERAGDLDGLREADGPEVGAGVGPGAGVEAGVGAEPAIGVGAGVGVGVEERSAWDTHPPLAVRLAAIAAAPDPVVRVDDRPAGVLLPDLGRAGRDLQAGIFDPARCTVVPWDRFLGAAASTALQRDMDGLLRTISRAVDRPVPHVGVVLDQIAAGRLDAMAEPIFPDATAREARKLFVRSLTQLFALAALRSGAARWQHSWTGPIRLIGADGGDLHLSDVATIAVDPTTVDAARAELARRGVDVTAARHVEQRATAGRSIIYGGFVNIVVDKRRVDLLVLDNGLLIVPGVPRLKMSTARRRAIRWIETGDPQPVLALEGTGFVPYEEIVRARQTRRVPVRYEVTLHGGALLDIRWGGETEQLADGKALLAKALDLT